MNILFVGPYRQNDGWGNAAKEHLRALRKTGHNVAARPVYLNNMTSFPALAEFEDLEANDHRPYDVVIQNCLPEMFRYYGGVLNIGLAYFESTINATPWPEQINLLDRMWVPSEFEQNTLVGECGIKIPVDVIPIACDPTKYEKNYEYAPLHGSYEHEFKFLFAGEFIGRKNVTDLLTAFHREFSVNEQVRLIIKTNKLGIPADGVVEQVQENINAVKQQLSMFPHPSLYKPEIVIGHTLSEEELYGLYCECDAFVMPSSGESFCIPAFDATMFGAYPIVNGNSSMTEYVDYGLHVESHKSPAIATDRPLPYLYTGRDTWYKIDVLGLQQAMRQAFEICHVQPDIRERMKSSAHSEILPRYTYDAVAKKMNEVLQ